MATYVKAGQPVRVQVDVLVNRHHPALDEAGVTIGVLLAHATRNQHTGEPEGPALKCAGYQVAASITVNSLRDRVGGLPDCTLLLDGDNWEGWPEPRQQAVIDECLQGLEVRRGDSGEVLLDDANRPRLKVLPPDFMVRGFWACAERHREHSALVGAAELLARRLEQLKLPWG